MAIGGSWMKTREAARRQHETKHLQRAGKARIHAAARQENACRHARSGAEVMRGLLSRYVIGLLPGESRAEALARAAGISTRELKNILSDGRETG
jgi:hypothetical protein